MCQLTEFMWQTVKENIALNSVIVLSTTAKMFNYSKREQTDLYSHLHTQRSPSAVSAPLPPAQAPPVAPGCSACSSTLQGSADRLRSSANTSGQNTAFCFCHRSNSLEIVIEINVAELVITLHSIIVFVNLCRHGKASNTEICF